MSNLTKKIKNKLQNVPAGKPEFFDLTRSGHSRRFAVLLKNKNLQVVDDFTEQLRELFAINNPPLAFKPDFDKAFLIHLNNSTKKIPLESLGKWVYFPWINALNHILDEKDFFAVRTARNKLLITEAEQKKFYNARAGIAGLSIGSSVAIALVLQGGTKYLRLADFDNLALSNTNRIRAGVQNLGLPKVEITARQIYEINPYAKLELFPNGVTEKNIAQFTRGLDILVDEMDSVAMKILLRLAAKKFKVPLVMGADNADAAIVDIERHDKNQKLKAFHGRLGNITYEHLVNMDKRQTGRTIAKLIGLENHTERMLNSLHAMGKTLVSWPQLGGTAMLNGSAVAYCVRKILAGQSLKDNRGILSLDEALQQNYFSKKEKTLRKKTVKKFKKIFEL